MVCLMESNVCSWVFSNIFFSHTENISKNLYTNKAQETTTVCLNEEQTENKPSPLGKITWQRLHFCSLGLWIAWTSKLTWESIEEVCICFWKTGLLQNKWKNQTYYSRDYIRVAIHTAKPERSLSQRDPWLDKIIFRCHTSKIQFLNQDMFCTVQMKTRALLSTARSLLSFGFRLSCLSIAPRHSTEDGHLIIWCCRHTDQE